MQEALTLHLEQHDHAPSQSSVNQLLSLPNHDKWVLAHQGFVAKTSAILLLGNLLVECAAEDCPHKVGECWNQLHFSWLKTFHVAGHSLGLFSTTNASSVSFTSCVTSHDLPRLMSVHDLCVLSQLLQWSCLSTPRERAHGITTREGVTSK